MLHDCWPRQMFDTVWFRKATALVDCCCEQVGSGYMNGKNEVLWKLLK
jgi:hypothetical protein